MYIYELEGYSIGEDMFSYEYITHEKEFSENEFEKICNEGLKTVLDKNVYELKSFLKLNYGFKDLNPICKLSFDEDW